MDKETIKQFFKPDQRKILITIIIILLVWMGYDRMRPTHFPSSFPLPFSLPFTELFSVFLFFPVKIVEFLQLTYTLSSIGLFIFTIIEIYVIACLVIFAYDKFRKRK